MTRLFLLLLIAVPAFAFFPKQVERSEAEYSLQADLAQAQSDIEILQIGKRYLTNYPDDIPAGKEAQNAISDMLEDKVAFFRKRHEELSSLASFYLYARAADFSLPDAEVRAVVDKHQDNFWAWLMFMATAWRQEVPDMNTVIDRAETAVTLNGSRPEGYFFLSLAYLEQDRLPDARAALEAGVICDPLDLHFREMLLDVYLKQRDADAYFSLMSGVLPEKPVEISLATLDRDEVVDSDNLRGGVTLLIYWALGSEICINNTLQKINQAKLENRLEWPIYAMHLGDELMDSTPLITETDRAGNAWQIKFVRSSDALNKQINLPQRPCVYVIGPDGYVHALVNGMGHSEDLIETVIWLADEVVRRM